MSSRYRAQYWPPEDHYEMLVSQFVTPASRWLDVGCGHAPFPNNLALSSQLSKKCQQLVGIDPDEAVTGNQFIHLAHQVSLDEFQTQQPFDLVTARMVVEHVRQPSRFAAALARVTHAGSHLILFTVNWLSLTALAAYYTPLAVHHLAKRLLWNTQERDTFPTEYRMNRRQVLRDLLRANGFAEKLFVTLADASLLWRFPVLRELELVYWQVTSALHLPYHDSCILAVYERVA